MKQPKINPYKEVESAQNEMGEIIDQINQDEEPEQEMETQEQKKDYLDEFTPQTSQPSNKHYSQPLMFSGEEKDENLVKSLMRVDWERIEHIIRGHKPKVDDEGNEYFVKIDEHYLNEYGVNSILHFLSFYLSKEIYLGRYREEQVQLILKQFSTQFTDFFYDNIVEFGLDTPKKKKMSKMFVHAVIDLVDSAYSKAIEGKTAELIFKQFMVTQNQPLETNTPFQNNPRQKTGFFQRIFG